MATSQVTGQAPAHFKRPAPLVSPFRHPLRWLGITLLSGIIALVLAHIGALAIAGLYYAVFEWNSHVTHWWHSFITNSNLRHDIRDVAEGFYGGAIAQQLIWNAFRKRRVRYEAKPMNRLDRIEDALRIPNLRSARELSFWQIPYALLLWAPVYGSVGFFVAYLLDGALVHGIAALHHTVTSLGPHASLWQRTKQLDTSNWDKKVMGLAASFFFGRRPLRKVFDGVQLWFAERHVASGKPMRWYYPPTFRARCNDVADRVKAGLVTVSDRFGTLQTVLVTAALVPAVVFAGLGYYVLAFIATKSSRT
ncbi:MAG TPA: hypothetical protein VGR98_05655 [Streptosporangiaceae bacterium]|jgi:hypothetical protein|nr:hypothetical protein [Streptosporangiaceae bacterium]